MGKSKSKSTEYTKEGLASFLTDLEARSKGVANGVRFWDTLGTAGREPVGNLGFNAGLLEGDNPASAFLPALRKGEINPYLEIAGADGKTSKKMYEYFASPAMPQLPKELSNQYDVVFAGTREADPSEEVWNTKTGSTWSRGPQNIWKFVPREAERIKPEKIVPAPVQQEEAATTEDDRPVSIGTLTYNDPNRFLGEFIRSIGVAPS